MCGLSVGQARMVVELEKTITSIPVDILQIVAEYAIWRGMFTCRIGCASTYDGVDVLGV